MNIRRTQHSHHPNYLQYDLALANWRKAESLWFRILNNKDRGQERTIILELLSSSKTIFKELAVHQFLSASSYLQKIEELYKKLGTKRVYDDAVQRLKAADDSKDLYLKRIKYSEVEQIFFSLGKFSSSEFYAKKAGQKYLESLKPIQHSKSEHSFFYPVSVGRNLNFSRKKKVNDESSAQSEYKVLIEGGHDLCVRLQLPTLSEELHTTTVITPQGVFQLDDAKKKYVCVLDPSELNSLDLGSSLNRAKEFNGSRISVKADLSLEQLERFDQALKAKGGRSLQENSEPRQPGFSMMG